MSLLEFFQLKETPFSITIDNRFFFKSQQHAEALLRLKHAAEQMKGLAIVVGDVGTGKTTLATRFLEELEPEQYEAALLIVLHAAVTSEWLLRKIALQMEITTPAESKTDLLTQLSRRLDEVADSGKKAIVLIDEAQMLRSQELMEDFRGLLNIESNGRKLVTFVLFGLPELDQVLALDRPLHQRVAIRYELTALNSPGTEAYINWRLRIAGAQRTIFKPETYPLICHYSKGIPRLINTVCDNALLEAYLRKQDKIEMSLIHEVAEDLKLGR
ncbi:MAG TPA: AAA family ATPase [Nitrospiraceae bacterium]|nr:AAA family ATPase [Nitrospiraceae bacterium]